MRRGSEGHVLLWRLLVSKIQEEDAGEGADQEDDVKPTVVEVELQLPQDVGDDGAILQWHAHAHQQHARHKVHPLRAREDTDLSAACCLCCGTN